MSDAPTSADGSAERWIDVVASTDALDSYDEIVEQSWDLSRFLANPVILYAHNSRGESLGYASNVSVVDGKLQMRLNFCDEQANPQAVRVYHQFKQKALRAVSVGFIPRDVRLEMRDGKEVFVLANNLLLEISPTPIGANPEALAKQHALIRSKALATKNQESPGAERANHTENDMDEKTKAALDAANIAREAAEKKAVELQAKLDKAIDIAVRAKIAEGRFNLDELETQTKIAKWDLDVFADGAAKRTVRGAEIVGAKALPDSPAGGTERAVGDGMDDGGELAALAKK